jgi:hypothetical protein
MTTSKEIKEHFGKEGLELVKNAFGYSNLNALNKDKEIKSNITYMVFSWYVDYGRKKWVWNVEDLITMVKEDKRITSLTVEELVNEFL